MKLSQNDVGRAFEYAIAVSMAYELQTYFLANKNMETARNCFDRCDIDDQKYMMRAASKTAKFLVSHDKNLLRGVYVHIQPDRVGIQGDVRDVIIKSDMGEVGISAKNNHFALKHSRLSENIDFCKEWMGVNCSDNYFKSTSHIFSELKNRKAKKEKWKDIVDKQERYYLPVLNAFQTEINFLFHNNRQENLINNLGKYLLGNHDYYKVIKKDKEVTIISFNIDGTLGWGNKISLPTNMIQIVMKKESNTTLIMTLDKGWQISFRIHNASEVVEPSLKFDIVPIGFPSNLSKQTIEY